MWPLDQMGQMLTRSFGRHTPECLRIGRYSVERWCPTDGDLAMQASVPVPPDLTSNPMALVAAISQLYPAQPRSRVCVVLESIWLPVILVETGSSLWSQSQAEALMRHRLQELYDRGSDPVTAWDVRSNFRAGDSHALGYGMSPHVQNALNQAADAVGVKWAAVVPALAWAWQRFQPASLMPHKTGWWGWQEQDRLLLARVASGQVTGLHPGLAPIDAMHDIQGLVRADAIRLGIEGAPEAICMAVWTSHVRTSTSDTVKCLSVEKHRPAATGIDAIKNIRRAAA